MCFAIGGWVYGTACSPLASRKNAVFAYVFVLLFAFMGCQAILFPRASWYIQDVLSDSKSVGKEWVGWEDFSPERVKAAAS